ELSRSSIDKVPGRRVARARPSLDEDLFCSGLERVDADFGVVIRVGVRHSDSEKDRTARGKERRVSKKALASLLVHFQERRRRSPGRRNTKQIEPCKYDGVVGAPRGPRNAAHRVGDLYGRATAQCDFAQRSRRCVPEAQPLVVGREERRAAQRTTKRPGSTL